MTVRAIARSSLARNGVGEFVHPCQRITLQYCNWGGSSDGMRRLLRSRRLDKLAESNPQIEFHVLRKPGHPILRAQYSNGREKVICVRGMNIDVVENKLKLLRDSSGAILRHRTMNDNVESLNESVRGIWSALHAPKHQI